MASNRERLEYYSKQTAEWVGDSVRRPLNVARKLGIQLQTKLQRRFREGKDNARQFDYDSTLLPNDYLAEMDAKSSDVDDALSDTGYSVGYPAWNLLYYALYTSLHFAHERPPVIVETGTNHGFSTIILAQVLKDLDINAKIVTVELHADICDIARKNVADAGLSDYVNFNVGDSLVFLENYVRHVAHIDFAFLDGNHEYQHVRREFDIIYPRIVAAKGKVYLDNTAEGGVKRAIDYIKRAYGGNVVEFLNCSWSPPGNAIWQP